MQDPQQIKQTYLQLPVHTNAQVNIRLNHLGFTPDGLKTAFLPSDADLIFELRRCSGDEVVYRQQVAARSYDLGQGCRFDFSSVSQPGTYYVKAGSQRSWPFRIDHDVYTDLYQANAAYFSVQRCGPSTTGYLSPCHCEDGIRMDNGTYRDVSGGWHDASDLRKWTSATIHGMIGLGNLFEICGEVGRPGAIEEEMRWGNRYFLAMQEKEGYIMAHCGGDVYTHSDSNRWTDNIRGNADDRIISTGPADLGTQGHFLAAQALMAAVSSDRDYVNTCLEAARRCAAYIRPRLEASRTNELAACLYGLARLAALDPDYEEQAFLAARLMLTRQGHDSQLDGYFYSEPDGEVERGFKGQMMGLSLAQLCRQYPDHPDCGDWKKALERYFDGYILALAKKNAYGIAPYGLYDPSIPGRKLGPWHYRYFQWPHEFPQPTGASGNSEEDFFYHFQGINGSVASRGVGLVLAAGVLDKPAYRFAAQNQLDWILGFNPLNASMVDLVGHNIHKPFDAKIFVPNTPRIRGAVMNGIAGNLDDEAELYDGQWMTCEYWTPMVSFTMWLSALLSRS